jgi:hypothetical protein
MQSVTKLSNDVRRGMRAATAISGLATLLVLGTILVGHEAQKSWLLTTNALGQILTFACLSSAVATAVILISVRGTILLRTAIWFDHAFTHHFLRRRTQGPNLATSLAEHKFALQFVAEGLRGGVAARQAEIIWLPLYWIALAAIDLWQAGLAFTVALALFVLSRFVKRTTPALIPAAMLSAFGAQHATTFDVDQWERKGRTATARYYAFHSHVSQLRLWLGCASIICFASACAGLAGFGYLNEVPYITAATLSCIHARHLWLAFAFLADRPNRQNIDRMAIHLASSSMTKFSKLATTGAPGVQNSSAERTTLDLRHAA